MDKTQNENVSKVPAVTVAFWVIKIAATTLGETGGDAVSMTMKLGYAVGTLFSLPASTLRSWRRSGQKLFTPFYIGWLSLPPRPLVRRWRIMRIVH